MNKTLIAGLVIIVSMILIAIFGPLLAPHAIDHRIKIEYVIDKNGEGEYVAPPAAPRAEYPLGTDKNGYDMLTKLLHGAKYTVLLSIGIAAARVLIGGLIGMIAGIYGKEPDRDKKSGPAIWSMLNGIPIFLIVWLLMIGISINPAASTFTMSMLLAVVLLVIGIPSIASTVKAKTLILREKQYVTASQSLGAGKWTIIRSHLLPHLKESFLILLVNEIMLILALFGQLALFQIFVGGTEMYPSPPEFHSRSNEWGGLIGQSRMSFYSNRWIFYAPLASYVLLIIGFHMTSKGLEKRYSKMFSKFSHL